MIQWLPKNIPFAKVYKKNIELPKFTTFLQNYVRTFGEIKSRDKLKELYNRFIMAIYDK